MKKFSLEHTIKRVVANISEGADSPVVDDSVVGKGSITYKDPKTGKVKDYMDPVTLNNPFMQASPAPQFPNGKVPLPPTRPKAPNPYLDPNYVDPDVEAIKKQLNKEEVGDTIERGYKKPAAPLTTRDVINAVIQGVAPVAMTATIPGQIATGILAATSSPTNQGEQEYVNSMRQKQYNLDKIGVREDSDEWNKVLSTVDKKSASAVGKLMKSSPDTIQKDLPMINEPHTKSDYGDDINKAKQDIARWSRLDNFASQPLPKIQKMPITAQDRAAATQYESINEDGDWNQLYSANKQAIGNDPNKIKVGQKLSMPDGSTYTVKAGDTLSKIAGQSPSSSASGAPKTIASATPSNDPEAFRTKYDPTHRYDMEDLVDLPPEDYKKATNQQLDWSQSRDDGNFARNVALQNRSYRGASADADWNHDWNELLIRKQREMDRRTGGPNGEYDYQNWKDHQDYLASPEYAAKKQFQLDYIRKYGVEPTPIWDKENSRVTGYMNPEAARQQQASSQAPEQQVPQQPQMRGNTPMRGRINMSDMAAQVNDAMNILNGGQSQQSYQQPSQQQAPSQYYSATADQLARPYANPFPRKYDDYGRNLNPDGTTVYPTYRSDMNYKDVLGTRGVQESVSPYVSYIARSVKPKQLQEKDNREYGYEGEMVMSQLKTLMRRSDELMKMLKPDTDLPEWVQSKITLAQDYIQTAADYMASEIKEEIALDEKLTKSMSAGDVIHDFVHSDDPKFKGKSTKERQRMALGAYYKMHPEKSKKMEESVPDSWEDNTPAQRKAIVKKRLKPKTVPGTAVKMEELFNAEELHYLNMVAETAVAPQTDKNTADVGQRPESEILDEAGKRGRPSKKDKDAENPNAGQGRDPREHIQVQAGRAMAGVPIKFKHENGEVSNITPAMGRRIVSHLNGLKPKERQDAVNRMHGSAEGLKV